MKPITAEDYFLRMCTLDLVPDEVKANAEDLLKRVNALLVEVWTRDDDPVVTSGWRTESYNKIVPNAAPKSKHITGEAIDLYDPDGELDQLLFDDYGRSVPLVEAAFTSDAAARAMSLLEKHGLYMEHPVATKGWCHLQSVGPRSGNRIFFP